MRTDINQSMFSLGFLNFQENFICNLILETKYKNRISKKLHSSC